MRCATFMPTIFLLLFTFVLFATSTFAQWNDVTITPQDLQDPTAPRFEDYAVPPRFKGRPANVNLRSHREARQWRTRLREGAKEGPNFADHFTVVTWGCGTDCVAIAVVDARNGNVYMPEALHTLSTVNIHDAVLDDDVLPFRMDSRLLVAVGMPNEDTKQRGVSYYEWTGTDLRLIFRVNRKWYDTRSNFPMQPTAFGGG